MGKPIRISITPSQAKLLLRVMDEDNPEFNYIELFDLSCVYSDAKDIVHT